MLSLVRKIVTFPLVRLVLAVVFVGAATALARLGVAEIYASTGEGQLLVRAVVDFAFTVPAVLVAYVGYVRLVERRAVRELGLGGMPLELAAGWALGAALFGAVVAALWLLGCYRVIGAGEARLLLGGFVGSLTTGFFEEIVFRAVLLRILEEALGSWLALGVSALLFGLLHLLNPHATWQGTIAIALEAGVLLGAAYMLTGRLWLACGLHAAWNFTQGSVFGITVSGTGRANGLLVSELSGPELLSGGEFGAEASLVAVLVCGAVAALMLVRVARAGRIQSSPWRARRSPAR